MESEIKPQSTFRLGIRELWEYRELFYFFTLRDVKVKYKQTVLGFLWAVIQPLAMAMIFTYFLGNAIAGYTRMPMDYELFALSGLVIWGIFSSGINTAGNSMVSNANIIRKIYFPRLIIPLSAILAGLVDFAMALIIFFVYVIFKGYSIDASAALYMPLAVLLACNAALGMGCLLAALNVKYRDVRYVIPFLIQFLLFVTPVIYPANIARNETVSFLFALNPMSAPLDLFRAGLEGGELHPAQNMISIVSSLCIAVAGLLYFRKTEAYFADLA